MVYNTSSISVVAIIIIIIIVINSIICIISIIVSDGRIYTGSRPGAYFKIKDVIEGLLLELRCFAMLLLL